MHGFLNVVPNFPYPQLIFLTPPGTSDTELGQRVSLSCSIRLCGLGRWDLRHWGLPGQIKVSPSPFSKRSRIAAEMGTARLQRESAAQVPALCFSFSVPLK